MKKYLYLILTLCVVSLTGCGKQEVNYAEENTTEEVQTTSTEEVASGTIQEILGINDEYKWKETVETDGGSAKVDAEIRIEVDGELSTLRAEKHYYSAEEKKQVLEHFFEPESIQVDRDTYPTKELLLKKLEQYETALEEVQSSEESSISEDEITMINNEKQKLMDRMSEAPAYNEVAEEVADYSENYYKGFMNGLEYSLIFDINEEENRSGWTLQAKDYSDFLTSNEDILAWQAAYWNEEANQCRMTQDEAEDCAEKIFNELGFTGLKRSNMQLVEWNLGNGEMETNGYYFEYTLDINGEFRGSGALFSAGVAWGGYIDTTKEEMPYDEAMVSIMINDAGIIRIECKGIVDAGEVSPVNLLSYDQIKECFRSVLPAQTGGMDKWTQLTLCYVRLSGLDNPDAYTYVPAWKMTNYGALPAIMLNAIDGTLIDMQNDIYVYYSTPEDWLTEYQLHTFAREGLMDEEYNSVIKGIVREMQ